MCHLGTPQKHRKRPDLTGRPLNQEVLRGLFQSSQATVLELWASPDLQGRPGSPEDTSWSQGMPRSAWESLGAPRPSLECPGMLQSLLLGSFLLGLAVRGFGPDLGAPGISEGAVV